jgi:O-antigen/teichoic acid export membrane protein
VLKQKFVLSYVSQLIIQMLGIIASIVIARVAGPNVMGKLTFGLSYVNMFAFLTQMGFGSAHIKLVSEGYPLDKCLGTYIRLISITTTFFVAVVLSFFIFQKYVLHFNFEGYQTEFCIYASIAVAVITSAVAVTQTTFSAKIQQAKQDVPNIVVNFISAIAKIVIVLLGFRVLMLASWNIIHVLLLLMVSVFLMRKQTISSFDSDLAKKYLVISAPLLLIGFANSVMLNLDKVLLKFLVSATEVGYYGASYRIGGFIQLIATNIGALFFPLFSMYITRGQYTELNDKVTQYKRISLLFVLPFVLFVMVFSPVIVRLLLGKMYEPSIIPMAIITLALYVFTYSIPYGNILIAAGKYKRAALNQVIVFVVYIIALIIFIHPALLNMKSVGTASALLVMYCITFILNRISAGKVIKLDYSSVELRVLAAELAVFFVFFILYKHFQGSLYLNLSLIGLFFVTMYVTLWTTRLLRKQDIIFLKQALNPQQMKNYIQVELSPSE